MKLSHETCGADQTVGSSGQLCYITRLEIACFFFFFSTLEWVRKKKMKRKSKEGDKKRETKEKERESHKYELEQKLGKTEN